MKTVVNDPADNEKLSVQLTRRDWRALKALMYSAISITEEPIHRTLFTRIFNEIDNQTIIIDIDPDDVEEVQDAPETE